MVNKSIFLSLLLVLHMSTLLAQKKSITGAIIDSITRVPVAMASIRNVNNGTAVISKKDGVFTADLAVGQIIAFSANGYYTDTISITEKIWQSPAALTLQLRPLPATLQDVVISSTYNAYQLDSLARRKNFLATVGENKIPAVGRTNDLGFGVAINLDHFKKAEQNKRHARSLFEIIEEDAYINYRWNEEAVKKYTSFDAGPLFEFMQDNRPTYAWLRTHATEEDLLYYINDKLKKLRKDKKSQ